MSHALGVMLFELLSGRPPFEGQSERAHRAAPHDAARSGRLGALSSSGVAQLRRRKKDRLMRPTDGAALQKLQAQLDVLNSAGIPDRRRGFDKISAGPKESLLRWAFRRVGSCSCASERRSSASGRPGPGRNRRRLF